MGGIVWDIVYALIPTWIITGLCLIKGVKSAGKVSHISVWLRRIWQNPFDLSVDFKVVVTFLIVRILNDSSGLQSQLSLLLVIHY